MKKIAIQGIQFDDKSSFQKGPKLAPPIIRETLQCGSLNLCAENGISIETPSIVIIKAYQDTYKKFDILQIDAHSDLYHEYEGDPYSHACPFARIMENGFAARLVQVGIRTLNPHQAAQAKKFNVEIHQMNEYDLSLIPKFENPLYISLDMDGFDPAFAPGVSHHEPGGLSSRQVIDLIQSIETEVIGADKI